MKTIYEVKYINNNAGTIGFFTSYKEIINYLNRNIDCFQPIDNEKFEYQKEKFTDIICLKVNYSENKKAVWKIEHIKIEKWILNPTI